MAQAAVKTKNKSAKKAMSVKQNAVKFAAAKNIINYTQAFLCIYTFLNTLFWFAYIAQVFDKSGVYFIFKPAWDFVGTFYTYKSVSGKSDIDYTGIVCTITFAIAIIILKSVTDYLGELEETAKIEDAKRLEKARKRALAIEQNELKTKHAAKSKSTGFIFMLNIDIKQIAGFVQSKVVSPQEIEAIKSKFFKSLLSNINLNQVVKKGYYKKKLFLMYRSLSFFDDFIFYTRETLNSLAREFTRPNIRIDFIVELNTINFEDELRTKLDILDMVNNLGIKNEYICTQALKDTYEYLPKQSYRMYSKGIYNLSNNLNISNNQEIYSLEDK